MNFSWKIFIARFRRSASRKLYYYFTFWLLYPRFRQPPDPLPPLCFPLVIPPFSQAKPASVTVSFTIYYWLFLEIFNLPTNQYFSSADRRQPCLSQPSPTLSLPTLANLVSADRRQPYLCDRHQPFLIKYKAPRLLWLRRNSKKAP